MNRLNSCVFWHLPLQVLPFGMTKTSVVTVACSLDFSGYLLQAGSSDKSPDDFGSPLLDLFRYLDRI